MSSPPELPPLREALRIFVGAATPVSTEIDPRGHTWCEAYLDQALVTALAALAAAPSNGAAQEALPSNGEAPLDYLDGHTKPIPAEAPKTPPVAAPPSVDEVKRLARNDALDEVARLLLGFPDIHSQAMGMAVLDMKQPPPIDALCNPGEAPHGR